MKLAEHFRLSRALMFRRRCVSGCAHAVDTVVKLCFYTPLLLVLLLLLLLLMAYTISLHALAASRIVHAPQGEFRTGAVRLNDRYFYFCGRHVQFFPTTPPAS